MAKNNGTKKADVLGAGVDKFEREVDLTLEEGSWWRPNEGDDEELTGTIERVKRGQFGEYLVVRTEDGIRFVNLHAMLEPLKRFVGQTMRIKYEGQDDGGRGVHRYRAFQVRRRLAVAPNRPARPDDAPERGGKPAE